MSQTGAFKGFPLSINWRSDEPYAALLRADRRAFAWEWLRRHHPYRQAWLERRVPPTNFGLLAYENPDCATPYAKPIWTLAADPQVLVSRPARSCGHPLPGDLFDIRCHAHHVAVAIDDDEIEHWLLTDGRWMVRLDLHDGTLLGGPCLLNHHIVGFESATPKLATIKQFGILARRGTLPPAMYPREPRAARWALELRTADALATGASHQEMARVFFDTAIAAARWRIKSESYRLRIRRLVSAARIYLDDPFRGPWFR